jgi:ATP-binding cassette, subfamily B, bacterial PglK
LFIVFFLKSRLERNGELMNLQRSLLVKLLNEGLGGIKDILISSTQKPYIDVYNSSNFKLRRSIGNVQIINRFPRYIVETMGTVVLATTVFFFTEEQEEFFEILPFLGALAMAAQRLLPLFQQLYAAVTEILAAMPALDSVLTNLNEGVREIPHNGHCATLEFSKQIEFRDICFNYTSSDTPIIKGVSFNIRKGERIGLIGPTGCGKTTLIDIFMGLLEPISGDILLDGVKLRRENISGLQRRIAHVPQDVFLSDASMAANVAFGVPENEIDYKRMREAIEKAQLTSTVDNMNNGLMTEVGEQGMRLSGGQRQRVGIARALYRDADIFVFDEATSALDQQTEQTIMSVIGGLGDEITMIIIAHRLNSLERCDRIVKLNEGKVVDVDNVKNI